jgi:hypothetical protein
MISSVSSLIQYDWCSNKKRILGQISKTKEELYDNIDKRLPPANQGDRPQKKPTLPKS